MKKILATSLVVALCATGVAFGQGAAVSANAANDNFLSETLFIDDGFASNAYDGNAMLTVWPGGDMWGISSRPLAAPTANGLPFAIADDSISIFVGDTAGIVDELDNGRFFGVVDSVNGLDSDGGTATWTFDISSLLSVDVSIDMAAMGDFEQADMYNFTYSIDGSPAATLFDVSVREDLSMNYFMASGSGPFTLDDPLEVDSTTLLTNNFATFTNSGIGTGNVLTIEFFGMSDGGTEAFAFRNLAVTPEPATLALLGLGGLLAVRRRRA